MKYLKLFEQLNGTFWEIDFDEYRESIPHTTFNDIQVKELTEWVSKNGIKRHQIVSGYRTIRIIIDDPQVVVSITIEQNSDYWMYVIANFHPRHKASDSLDVHKFYKCDQIYGVIDLLNFLKD